MSIVRPMTAKNVRRAPKPRQLCVPVLVAVLLLSTACSQWRPCRDGTLLVTVDPSGLSRMASRIEIFAALDGDPAEKVYQGPSGRTLLSREVIEITGLPRPGHPHPAVVLTVVALSNTGEELGRSTAKGTVTGTCLPLAPSFGDADGGAGGRGGHGGGDLATGGAAAGGTGMGGSGAGGRGGTGLAPGGMTMGGAGAGGAAAGGTSTGGTGAGGRGGTGLAPGGMTMGGAGTGGVSIAGTGGGGAVACQGSETRCAGADLQTCQSGQWSGQVPCGANRTCAGPSGTAKCTCKVDPTCTASGAVCTSSPSAAVMCAQDLNGCFYAAASSVCTNGACSGGACCTNQCTTDANQCANGIAQTCFQSGNGCMQLKQEKCADTNFFVCERYEGPACADGRWAQWPAPNTPADTGSPHPQDYTDNLDLTITDNVTKLMWQQRPSPATYTGPQAVTYCTDARDGNFRDWRMPSQIELLSIVDYGRPGPLINSIFGIPVSGPRWFWSSTSKTPPSRSTAWFVNFDDGTTTPEGGVDIPSTIQITNSYYVRCVR